MEYGQKITPELLLNDNARSETQAGVESWREVRDNPEGGNIVLWVCGDSRIKVPKTGSYIIRSIASGGPRDSFRRLLSSEKVRGVMVLGHHPICGGLNAKAQMVESLDSTITDEYEDGREEHSKEKPDANISRYVQSHIWHKDPVLNAISAASITANEVDKPVLAGSMDHRSLVIYPTTLIWGRGRRSINSIPWNFLLDEQYDENKIKRFGIQTLDENEISPMFAEVLGRQQLLVESIRRRLKEQGIDKSLEELQEAQNPRTIIITNQPKPTEVLYPNLFGNPGSAFILTSPRLESDREDEICEAELIEIFNQSHYPFAHFDRLETCFIETGDIAHSRQIATILSQRSFMQQWLEDEKHHILVGQTNGGKARFIEVFKH